MQTPFLCVARVDSKKHKEIHLETPERIRSQSIQESLGRCEARSISQVQFQISPVSALG